MYEVYIIYNKNTGKIRGSGRLNRRREILRKDFHDNSFSSILETVKRCLYRNPDFDVVYTPNKDWFPTLPDPILHKVVDGAVILLSEQELQDIETKNQQKELINQRVREIAKQSLID